MAQPVLADVRLEVTTPVGKCTLYRPDSEEVQETAQVAKAIFVEAFSTSYTNYYLKSGSVLSIEKWLRLKDGLSLNEWLSKTFDGEYEEYQLGQKNFIYLHNEKGNLVGWFSHSLVSESGDVYLSQGSLEAASRHNRVATTFFAEIFKQGLIRAIFPGVKELKLIVRKINAAACHFYEKVGFTKDETIDPKVYGETYDDRYVGFRMLIPDAE